MSENPYLYHTEEWWAWFYGSINGYNQAIEDAVELRPSSRTAVKLLRLKKVEE